MDDQKVAIVEAASQATKLGIAVVPVREDGSKRPDVPTWAVYQERIPTRDELRGWFAEYDRTGLGWITGKVSGGLECLDFDAIDAFEEWHELITSVAPELWEKVAWYTERTPKGVHVFWRSESYERNLRLARSAEGASRIETRGEGGFVVVAPSYGGVHPSGNPYTATGEIDQIATISSDERDLLLGLARSLDRMPRLDEQTRVAPVEVNGQRPGDIYASRVSWSQVLEPSGWLRVHQRGAEEFWRRPGARTAGMDATTNYADSGLLYVFSTSAAPFEPERGYGKFSAFALLQHGGDYQAAARDLAAQGYVEDVPESDAPVVTFSKAAVSQKQAGARSDGYKFSHGWPQGHFVERYITYASGRTDAAHEYHEAAALALLSAFSAGVRTYMTPWPDGLATNLYFLLLGGTTSARKSTSLAFARRMIQKVDPSMVMPERATPEAMIEQLAGRPNVGSVIVGDEFGEQLGNILHGNTYMAALSGMLLELYGARRYKYTRRSKRTKDGTMQADYDEAVNPHLVILTASTGAIFEVVSSRDVQSGLMPRIGIVYPETFPPRRPIYEPAPDDGALEDWLVDYLQRLHLWSRAVTANGGEAVAKWGHDAAVLADTEQQKIENRPEEIVQRLAAAIGKIAMLSALGDEVPSKSVVTVETRDARQAIRVVQRLEDSALRFADEIGGLSQEQRRTEQAIDRVRRMLLSERGTSSRSDVGRTLKMSARQLDDLEATMVDRGIIKVMQQAPDGPGRPAKVWGLQ